MVYITASTRCDPRLVRVQQDGAGRVWVEFAEHGGFALMPEDAQALADKITEMVREIEAAKDLSVEERGVAALMGISNEAYSRSKANLIVEGVLPKKKGK